LAAALSSGAATEHFARMVAALGGPTDLIEHPDTHLPAAPVRLEVLADKAGFIQRIDTRAVGLAVVALGGGRTRPGDGVDPRVGFDHLAPIGTLVPGQPLGVVHAADDEQAERAATALRQAYGIGEARPAAAAPVIERIG
jgi:thymidine phosphorylase